MMGKKYKGLSPDDWNPFEGLLFEILSGIKEKKVHTYLNFIR